jgi:hypothetical protein
MEKIDLMKSREHKENVFNILLVLPPSPRTSRRRPAAAANTYQGGECGVDNIM